jgi:hypothetical protein
MFHTILTINIDDFPKHHRVAGLCNGDAVGLLSGRNWIFIYYIYELWLQMKNLKARPNTSNSVIIYSVRKWRELLCVSWTILQLRLGACFTAVWCCLYKFEIFFFIRKLHPICLQPLTVPVWCYYIYLHLIFSSR